METSPAPGANPSLRDHLVMKAISFDSKGLILNEEFSSWLGILMVVRLIGIEYIMIDFQEK